MEADRTIYHGTSRTFAAEIVGPPPAVDVTRGEGEFGRGFYCGSSKGKAASLAAARNRLHAVVLVTLTTAMLNEMKVKNLDHRHSNKLRTRVGLSQRSTYLVHRDVVIGTLANEPNVLQYKFETHHAETLLRTRGNLRKEDL